MSEKIVVSDKEAVEVLNTTKYRRAQPANFFVTRTIMYPVTIFFKEGIPTTEIRSFVRQSEFCSRNQWEKALELEKQYPELQKEYRKGLKARGLPINVREPANLLKATIIGVK